MLFACVLVEWMLLNIRRMFLLNELRAVIAYDKWTILKHSGNLLSCWKKNIHRENFTLPTRPEKLIGLLQL